MNHQGQEYKRKVNTLGRGQAYQFIQERKGSHRQNLWSGNTEKQADVTTENTGKVL